MAAVHQVNRDQAQSPRPPQREGSTLLTALSVDDDDSIDVGGGKRIAAAQTADKEYADYNADYNAQKGRNDDEGFDCDEISRHDVLFGDNDRYNLWPGNLQMQEWIEERRPAFMMATKRAEQTRIAHEVMLAVQSQDPPGRFLEQDALTEEWSRLDETDVFFELGKALRQPTSHTGTSQVSVLFSPYARQQLLHTQALVEAATSRQASLHNDCFSVASELPHLAPIYHDTWLSPMAAAQEASASILRTKAQPRRVSLDMLSSCQPQQRQEQQQQQLLQLQLQHPLRIAGAGRVKRKQPDDASASVASPTAQRPQPPPLRTGALPQAWVPRFAAARTVPLPSLQCRTSTSSALLPNEAKKRRLLSSLPPHDMNVPLTMKRTQLALPMSHRNRHRMHLGKHTELFAADDNAASNARSTAARSQQPTASSPPTTTKELPKGVTIRPSGKWQSQLYFCGQSRYIGVFANAEEAALAYALVRQRLAEYRGPGQPKLDKDEAERVFEGARRSAEAAISERRKQREAE